MFGQCAKLACITSTNVTYKDFIIVFGKDQTLLTDLGGREGVRNKPADITESKLAQRNQHKLSVVRGYKVIITKSVSCIR